MKDKDYYIRKYNELYNRCWDDILVEYSDEAESVDIDSIVDEHMNDMTICQCCEAISELTHDEVINDILNYIELKATHMSNKLAGYKENSFTKNELDYIYMKIFGYSKDVSYCVDFSKQEKHDIEVSILEKILELRGESHDK